MPRPEGEVGLVPPWLSTLPTLGNLFGFTEQGEENIIPAGTVQKQPSIADSLLFPVGALVEYESTTAAGWIPAKVIKHRSDGLYDLDCKPGVPPSKVRSQDFALPEYEVGGMVDYFSHTTGGWIPARVKVYNGLAGTYDLDVKANVHPSRIRHQITGDTGIDARTPTHVPSLKGLGQRLEVVREESWAEREAAAEEVGGSSSSRSVPSTLEPDQAKPLQLVHVVRHGAKWHFELNADACKVLETYGQRRVALCTVCGPYRTGKSYLLNLLLGRSQKGLSQFRVGSTSQACTEGLWMWGVGDQPSAGGTSLLFLDCEGFGNTASDKTRDAQLMSLCMSLSSVFLLNTRGVLSESLFNALSLVCKLSEHLEDEGVETSKPALLWILRDFLLELVDEDGKHITADEYLDSSLRRPPRTGADPDRIRASREVRDVLLGSFAEHRCVTLAQPVVDEDQLRQLHEVPFAQLRPKFQIAFKELRLQLIRMARARPKTVSGQHVTASGLVGLLRRLVASLNSGASINIASAWAQVQQTSCEALRSEIQERASAELLKIREGGPLPVPGGKLLPVSDEELAAAMTACRKTMHDEWHSRAVGEDAVKAEYWRGLEVKLADDEKSLRQLNAQLAEAQLQEASVEWEAWLSQPGPALATDLRSEALLQLLEKPLPTLPLARAAREAIGAARLSRLRWDGALEAAKSELKLSTDELASMKHAQATAADAQLEQSREVGRLRGQLEAQNGALEAAKVEIKLSTDELTSIVHAQATAADVQLEQSREVGRLRGQVEALQAQAKDAIDRERALREQVLLADEVARKEQRAQAEAIRQRAEAEQTLQDLRNEVAGLREELGKPRDLEAAKADEPPKVRQPKCGCAVM
eukprot:TRINITY_DN3137_c0_g1_i1.p1 TRINITY_DN3137_c0_g1~~TRINITY_DN3137_c0_g1_i1.p1  ORF type:complete len:870 (+),score=175.86 TRINITY_DN3137_c0_g1_i1:95-2704(+)